MSLHPTKNRIALLADIASGRVFRDAINDSYISAGRKVTATIAEMLRAGWVELDDSKPGDYWRLTDAGRKVLDAQATRYRVEFDRIGRNHNVASIEVSASNADEVAEAVYRVAARHLISGSCTVDVDLAAGNGWIEGGRFGTFTVTRVGAE